MSNRDDFAKLTIDILAKRVGYFCSNPKCKKPTSGPNSNEQKHTSIGVAAHISAAAPGGPRYDAEISAGERKHISNGVWLCNNCATLIDKDAESYPSEQLRVWKYQAELDMKNAISSQSNALSLSAKAPILEADLMWNNSMRSNKGYNQNLVDLWEVKWRFALTVHNNSSFPAYNVQIESDPKFPFFTFNELRKVNNLSAFANINLEVSVCVDFEGDYTEVEALTSKRIPDILNGMRLKVFYKDESRNEHEVLVIIQDGEVINQATK